MQYSWKHPDYETTDAVIVALVCCLASASVSGWGSLLISGTGDFCRKTQQSLLDDINVYIITINHKWS